MALEGLARYESLAAIAILLRLIRVTHDVNIPSSSCIRAQRLYRRLLWMSSFLFIVFVSPARSQQLGYHEIRTDINGNMLPWYSDDPATSYDFCIRKVWDFWQNIQTCCDSAKYYMISRTWDPGSADSGIGGDQFAMAMSSWSRLYAYSGDTRLIDNMRYMADTYLQNGLSDSLAVWPNIPYPCNMTQRAKYDGDLISGIGYTQPDKAGSFGAELLTLYKITLTQKYLDAAIAIANTLASHTSAGDSANSPMPFRVQATTGEVANPYTTNWTGTLRLFQGLLELAQGQTKNYVEADSLILRWLLTYPVRSNVWGPFYEDVGHWSNTQINACAFARYILDHPALDPDWKRDARNALDWTYLSFADSDWSDKHVFPIKEQTDYMVPGNSHTSDYGSAELLYAERTGDTSRVAQAVRQLNWATYMVDTNGANRYPQDAIWLTDGYGDYVRYYLYSMASNPILAPVDMPHILRTSSTISSVVYDPDSVEYTTFDSASIELLRLPWKPGSLKVGNSTLSSQPLQPDGTLSSDGWAWNPMAAGGTLLVRKSSGVRVSISQIPAFVSPSANATLRVSVLAPNSLVITDASESNQPINIQLLNVLGVSIMDREIAPVGTRTEIELPRIPDGMYFVRISRGAENVFQKIILSSTR